MIDREEKIGAECERLRENLSAYLDGECDQHEAAEIKAHIESCAECRELYKRFSAISYNTNNMKTNAPSDLHHSIMRAVADARAAEGETAVRKLSLSARVRRISTWCGAGVAALICIALLGGPLLGSMNDISFSGNSGVMAEADRVIEDGGSHLYSTSLDPAVGLVVKSSENLVADGAEAPTRSEEAVDVVCDQIFEKILCENTAADDECESVELLGFNMENVLPRRGRLKIRK